MGTRWVLTLWDGTEISRQVPDLAEAVKGYEWSDITKIRLIDQDGIERDCIAYNWDEAERYYELATNVAEKCIWMQAAEAFSRCYKKLKRKTITEVIIL